MHPCTTHIRMGFMLGSMSIMWKKEVVLLWCHFLSFSFIIFSCFLTVSTQENAPPSLGYQSSSLCPILSMKNNVQD